MKLLISAGGTGGHIFPGIAVAEAFTGMHESNDVVFVGTRQGLEGGIMPRHGFRLLFIEAHQFQGKNIFSKMATLIRLVQGIRAAKVVINLEKPDAILGMGGFTCVPTILAGVLLGLPTYLHEQNVEPGLANKLLSGLCTQRLLVLKHKKVFETKEGLPCRKPTQERRSRRGKHGKRRKASNVFIFGGNRGREVLWSVLTPSFLSWRAIGTP